MFRIDQLRSWAGEPSRIAGMRTWSPLRIIQIELERGCRCLLLRIGERFVVVTPGKMFCKISMLKFVSNLILLI